MAGADASELGNEVVVLDVQTQMASAYRGAFYRVTTVIQDMRKSRSFECHQRVRASNGPSELVFLKSLLSNTKGDVRGVIKRGNEEQLISKSPESQKKGSNG